MLIDITTKNIIQADIDSEEAFKILCKALKMEFVLWDDTPFFVRKNYSGENCVYLLDKGNEKQYDDRGDLFVALRNVAVNIFPNLSFRSAEYIYK